MSEYKVGKSTVRVHGTTDTEKLKIATAVFIKKAMKSKKEKQAHEKTSEKNQVRICGRLHDGGNPA